MRKRRPGNRRPKAVATASLAILFAAGSIWTVLHIAEKETRKLPDVLADAQTMPMQDGYIQFENSTKAAGLEYGTNTEEIYSVYPVTVKPVETEASTQELEETLAEILEDTLAVSAAAAPQQTAGTVAEQSSLPVVLQTESEAPQTTPETTPMTEEEEETAEESVTEEQTAESESAEEIVSLKEEETEAEVQELVFEESMVETIPPEAETEENTFYEPVEEPTTDHADHHVYEEIILEVPDCIHPGRARYICTICDGYYETLLPETGEHFFELVGENPRTYRCSVCGAEYSE